MRFERRRVGQRLPQPDWGQWGRRRAAYRPRGASDTPLHRVVQHHLETYLAQAAEAEGEGTSPWVGRDFRGYRECGILAYGFARARCEECGHERLIPFSCKGRGVCPSFNARRMCEVAAHLTDHVLPRLPVRQWVLSVPKRLRPVLHHDARVAGAVLQVFLRAIRTALRDASPGVRVRSVRALRVPRLRSRTRAPGP